MSREVSTSYRSGALRIATAASLALVWLPSVAEAENDVVLIDVAEAMATPEYQAKLDGSVKFYFGKSAHPPVKQKFANLVTNKKTNAFAKPAGVACRHVLLSALIALENQAKSLGGDAVINITSFFKRAEVTLDREAECHKGALMAGVALKGDVVKLGK